jgi:two-component system NtrC family sensor kinase
MIEANDVGQLILMAQAMEEQVLILGPQGVIHANEPAAELFGKKADKLMGLMPEELLRPAPALVEPGQTMNILARVAVARGEGPLVQGKAAGLESGGQLWVLQGHLSLVDLGSLAAGLIHNLAGPLSVIRSSAELLERYQLKALETLPALAEFSQSWPSSVQNGFRVIVDHVDQITGATRDLLAKLRGEATRRESPLDLNEILERELRFAENNLGLKQQVRQEIELVPNMPLIKGLYSDFSHSFRNLLRNAVQAMEDAAPKELKVSTALEQDHIVVRIQDSGKGIPAKDLEKIFDPFFTTRPRTSRASGLGLYSVRQLLMPYDVSFEVKSRPGQTAFTLRVPLHRDRVRG